MHSGYEEGTKRNENTRREIKMGGSREKASTQKHSLECDEVKSKTVIEGKYEDIFDEDIPSGISKTLLRIGKLREELF